MYASRHMLLQLQGPVSLRRRKACQLHENMRQPVDGRDSNHRVGGIKAGIFGVTVWWGIELHLHPNPESNESCGCRSFNYPFPYPSTTGSGFGMSPIETFSRPAPIESEKLESMPES